MKETKPINELFASTVEVAKLKYIAFIDWFNAMPESQQEMFVIFCVVISVLFLLLVIRNSRKGNKGTEKALKVLQKIISREGTIVALTSETQRLTNKNERLMEQNQELREINLGLDKKVYVLENPVMVSENIEKGSRVRIKKSSSSYHEAPDVHGAVVSNFGEAPEVDDKPTAYVKFDTSTDNYYYIEDDLELIEVSVANQVLELLKQMKNIDDLIRSMLVSYKFDEGDAHSLLAILEAAPNGSDLEEFVLVKLSQDFELSPDEVVMACNRISGESKSTGLLITMIERFKDDFVLLFGALEAVRNAKAESAFLEKILNLDLSLNQLLKLLERYEENPAIWEKIIEKLKNTESDFDDWMKFYKGLPEESKLRDFALAKAVHSIKEVSQWISIAKIVREDSDYYSSFIISLLSDSGEEPSLLQLIEAYKEVRSESKAGQSILGEIEETSADFPEWKEVLDQADGDQELRDMILKEMINACETPKQWFEDHNFLEPEHKLRKDFLEKISEISSTPESWRSVLKDLDSNGDEAMAVVKFVCSHYSLLLDSYVELCSDVHSGSKVAEWVCSQIKNFDASFKKWKEYCEGLNYSNPKLKRIFVEKMIEKMESTQELISTYGFIEGNLRDLYSVFEEKLPTLSFCFDDLEKIRLFFSGKRNSLRDIALGQMTEEFSTLEQAVKLYGNCGDELKVKIIQRFPVVRASYIEWSEAGSRAYQNRIPDLSRALYLRAALSAQNLDQWRVSYKNLNLNKAKQTALEGLRNIQISSPRKLIEFFSDFTWEKELQEVFLRYLAGVDGIDVESWKEIQRKVDDNSVSEEIAYNRIVELTVQAKSSDS